VAPRGCLRRCVARAPAFECPNTRLPRLPPRPQLDNAARLRPGFVWHAGDFRPVQRKDGPQFQNLRCDAPPLLPLCARIRRISAAA
jgi:hypothetical protein